MTWATRRKIQYLSILVTAIIIVFVVPFYMFIYKAPTCFDGFKNGDETGVDCGGACSLVCSAKIAEPISRWDPRVFSVSPGVYSVLVYFENPNVTAEVLSAPYTFKLYDSNNVLVSERSGKTLIPRGQIFALYEGNIETGERVPTRATFEFGELVWTKNVAPIENISVTNKALTREDTMPRVDALVTNNSTERISHIEFVAIVYDGALNAIGASKTFIDNLLPGASKPLVFTWPKPFVTKSDSCDQPVDVALLLDRSGSMTSISEDPPQPLTDVKNAASLFVQKLRDGDQATVISFANEASKPIDISLTANFGLVKDAIERISVLSGEIQNTNIADAIAKGREELLSERSKNTSQKILIALTDGVANRPQSATEPFFAEKEGQKEALLAKEAGIVVYAIGLGEDINANFLASIASSTDELYLAPTTETLDTIYSQIATKICKRRPAVIEVIPHIIPQ